MIRTLKGIRNALRRFANKGEPTGETDLKLDPSEIIADRPSPRRMTPPIAPKGFNPEAFFKGITWYQKWEVFDGIFTPGANPVSDICDLMQLPADLSGRRILDIGSANGCMSLECERRGAAEVIGLTPLDGLDWGHRQLRDAVGATGSDRTSRQSNRHLSPRVFPRHCLMPAVGVADSMPLFGKVCRSS